MHVQINRMRENVHASTYCINSLRMEYLSYSSLYFGQFVPFSLSYLLILILLEIYYMSNNRECSGI